MVSDVENAMNKPALAAETAARASATRSYHMIQLDAIILSRIQAI